jgi:hypothetical protein
MYENKNDNRPKRRPNIKVKAPLILDGYAGRATYSLTKAEEMFAKLNDDGIFKSLTIPVYVNNSVFLNDDTKKGTRVAGFIDSIVLENDDDTYPTVYLSLYPTYEEMMNRMGDPEVAIRAFAKNSEIVKVNQFVLNFHTDDEE